MSDQIKISPSLQDAQAFIAECLEFVSHDAPFVLDFYGEDGCYVQSIRGTEDEIFLELSGPSSVKTPISQIVIDRLVALGWGLPNQPEVDTPNFWREYPEDADFTQIAQDAILGVAVAFPDAKFISTMVDSIMNMDEAIELIEQSEKVFVQPVADKSKAQKKVRIHSAWQNYDEAKFRCSPCKKSWLGSKTEKDYEGLVLGIRCPECHGKLRNLSVEATEDQIRAFAEEGSKSAIEHLEMLDRIRNSEGEGSSER